MAFTFKHGDRPLDDFTVQRAVGRGGFGEVYYAISDGGREVALKYLRDNPEVELRGVSACINLKSPHLVSIFDVRKNNQGDYFIVMEYIAGPSLRDLLVAAPEGLGPQKAAFFIREIAKGLAYLHDRGIVHRDLKPGNIFYDEGYVKIGDYGLSKFMSVSRHSGQTASVGTVHYMAPEVGTGNYHRGIDIYALGVILYEMLLGKVPFEGSSIGEVLMKHLQQQPEVDNLPAPFGQVIRKALEKDPKDRYASVHEMAEDLLEVDTVRESVAGFDPGVLSTIGRQAAEVESPWPSPNPPPRQPAWESPTQTVGGEGGKPQAFNLDVNDLPKSLAKRIANRREHVEARVAELGRRVGSVGKRFEARQHRVHGVQDQYRGRGGQGSGITQPTTEMTPARKRSVLARLIIGIALFVGLSVATGLITGADNEEVFAGTGFLLAGCTAGVFAGRWLSRRVEADDGAPHWVRSLCLIGGAALFVTPGVGIFGDIARLSDANCFAAGIGLVIALCLLDWEARIRAGRRGDLSFSQAFTAGVVALICFMGASMVFQDGNPLVLRLMIAELAATSILVQALAWLLKRRSVRPVPTPPRAPTRPAPNSPDYFAPADRQQDTAAPNDPGSRGRTSESRRKADYIDDADYLEYSAYGRAPRPGWKRATAAILALSALIAAMVLFIGTSVSESARLSGQTIYQEPEIVHTVQTYAHQQSNAAVAFVNANATHGRFGTLIGVTAAVVLLGLAATLAWKTTRYPRGGFYRETFRPLALTTMLGGITGAASMLYFDVHIGMPEFVVVIIGLACALGFAVFLLVRGRSWSMAASTPLDE